MTSAHQALDAEIMAAHERDDIRALGRLYGEAGALMEASDINTACFLYTQAYIFSLQAGLPEAEHLRQTLKKHGRES